MGDSKKKLIKMVDRMPAFPHSVYKILQLTSDINCDPKDLVVVFEHDPVLAVQLLKMVNTPYFGLSHKISSINQAVVFVGINTLKNLALRIVPVGSVANQPLARKSVNPLVNTLLLHNNMTAVIARRLAQRMGVAEVDVADYFVAGLLHDFGQVVFARCQPKRFQRVVKLAKRKKLPITKMEKRMFGMDHTELGAYMGEKWCLPQELTDSMRSHHERVTKRATLLHDCIYTASLLASLMDPSYFDHTLIKPIELPKSIISHFGKTLPELLHTIGDVADEISKLRMY